MAKNFAALAAHPQRVGRLAVLGQRQRAIEETEMKARGEERQRRPQLK